MMRFETAHATVAYRNSCEDHVAIFNSDDRTIIVVADGAGGTGSGDLAAKTVVREMRDAYSRVASAEQWVAELARIDRSIGNGESTAVIVDLTPERVCGASVGDSQAWIFCDGNPLQFTAQQHRKPLLGSGEAVPVGFSFDALRGTLIVATDGFWNYVKQEKLLQVVAQTDFYALPRVCIELVRLPSGELWDDVGIVVCRVRLLQRTRQR